MMKIGLALVAFFMGVSSVMATDYDMITDLGTSARYIAIGGVEGFGKSAASVFENPAALYRINQAGFSFFTTTLISEIHYNQLSMVTDTSLGKFGVGYMSATVSDVPYTGKNTQNEFYVKETFDYQNTIMKLSYQNSLAPDLHVGGSLSHYTHHYYDVEGSGHNLDAGLIWVQPWGQLSFSGKNLLWDGVVTYKDGKTEKVQTDFVLGYGNRFFEDVDLMGQILRRGDDNLFSLGGIYTPSFLPNASLMAGYREYMVLGDVKNKWSLGLGLHLFALDFYYAYEKSDHVEFDGNHYFSMDFNL